MSAGNPLIIIISFVFGTNMTIIKQKRNGILVRPINFNNVFTKSSFYPFSFNANAKIIAITKRAIPNIVDVIGDE